MIKILKASAGSGKTYQLAETYIRLLLEAENPTAYRHILAVTFTNKATEEMKNRILKELYQLSTDPQASPYFGDFVPALLPTAETLQQRSGAVLQRLLHDYGAFAISTIDRFFQMTLKAFSREIGHFATYQVELDRDSLVEESVDRILDGLSEDRKELLDWLSESVMEQLEKGERFNLEGRLKDMAKRLKSEEHRTVVEANGIDEPRAYSTANLRGIKQALRRELQTFAEGTREAARAVMQAFTDNGLHPADTSRGFLDKAVSPFLDFKPGAALPKLADTFFNTALDYERWFRKADRQRYAGLERVLLPPVQAFHHRLTEGMRRYNTARLLIGQIGDLAIAADLYREFDALMQEKNLLCLDDSNVLLKRIIDGSDALFVYEKLGVRFEHFLLDEFQDTSRVQWDNFRPLIANSDASGFENLLVGDVKQSIYRWRGSDWELMDSRAQAELKAGEAEHLTGNWRSLRNIVEFNNGFFEYAAGVLDAGLGDGAPVSALYRGRQDALRQTVQTRDPAEGSVDICFCEAGREPDAVLDALQKVEDAGALPGDITILVRNNAEGSTLAAFLIAHGIDVISDDSLKLKSSAVVRKLVSLLSCVKNPDDTIGSYLARTSGLDPGRLAHRSLVDLCEQLLRLLSEQDGSAVADETLYIQSFMDVVQEYVTLNGNALDGFLKAWNDADPKVSSPADAQAVRVMTIHKAKGLEAPYVIFPFAEKVGLFRPEHRWVVPPADALPLQGTLPAAFDVNLTKNCPANLFEPDYRREVLLQYVDNINTFYVALTRAAKGMTVIAAAGSGPGKDFSGILRAYLEAQGEALGFGKEAESPDAKAPATFRKGSLYDFRTMKRPAAVAGWPSPGYPSAPLAGRLQFSRDSVDFFSDAEDLLKPRQNGIVLHGILASVRTASDLDGAVETAFRDGSLDREQADAARELLGKRIAAHPDWFPEPSEMPNAVRTETALIDIDGETYRPDRVLIRGGRVLVLDYKFGRPKADHLDQVARYAGIYRRMGYADVRTAVWYVPEDRVV